MKHAERPLGRWIVWAIALVLLYELVEDSPVPDELAAGAVAGVLCALLALRLRGVATTRYAARWNELRRFAGVPWSTLRDTAVVGWAILRSLRDPQALKGSVECLPFDYGDAHDPADATRRALLTLGTCLPPNSVVCMMREDEFVIHRLTAGASPGTSDRRWPI